MSQPPDAIGVQLLDAPASRQDDPRASRSIVDHLRPGDVIERRIQVSSTYDEPLVVPVYPEGATLTNGQFVPNGRDSEPAPIMEWVTVEPSPLELDPMETDTVLVTIAVPRDVPDGEYYGAVFAEAPPSGGTIQSINRAGVRLYLSIGTGIEPPSDFEVDSLVALRGPEGEPRVEANITNTGERALDLRGELTLTDGPGGLSAGPFPTQGVATLGAEQTGRVFVPLDEELPDGPWLATLVARSGTLERTAQATITFPSEESSEADPAAAEETAATGGDADGDGINDDIEAQRRALLPLAGVLILLAIGALWLMLLWKRREEEEEDEDGEDADAAAASASTGATDDGA